MQCCNRVGNVTLGPDRRRRGVGNYRERQAPGTRGLAYRAEMQREAGRPSGDRNRECAPVA
jgi:hypothetical protein